jgi:hypothetical protein
LQYLQFLQAWHGLAPVQVAYDDPPRTADTRANASSIDQTVWVLRGIFHPLSTTDPSNQSPSAEQISGGFLDADKILLSHGCVKIESDPTTTDSPPVIPMISSSAIRLSDQHGSAMRLCGNAMEWI